MNATKTLTAALLATSAMTGFSVAAAEIQDRQFREPEVLARLISRAFPPVPRAKATLAGWIVHYAAGLTFCSVYDILWRKTLLKPTYLNGAIIGAVSGLVGIFAWRKTLAIHPDPPHLKTDNYFGHLLVAHMIFGAVAVLPYRKKARHSSANESQGPRQIPTQPLTE